jgi:hypothetical protein
MTLEEAFQNYKGAVANSVYTGQKASEADALRKAASDTLAKAQATFAGMLGNGAFIHEDQVFTGFGGQIIYAHPIKKE